MITLPLVLHVDLTETEARQYLGYTQKDEDPVNEEQLKQFLKHDLQQWIRLNVKNNS